MKLFFTTLASAVMLAGIARSEPLVKPGTCELIIASRQTNAEAQDVLIARGDTQYAKIFTAQNGWYAVSIGALKFNEEKAVISSWKASGRIPQDAYCSTGAKYTGGYDWSTKNRLGTSGSTASRGSETPTPSQPSGSSVILGGVSPEQYKSCTFKFETKNMAISWASMMTLAGFNGYEDVNSFMYGIMCDWRPDSTFIIGGEVKDSDGYFVVPTLSDGRREVKVAVNGCSFDLSFGEENGKFNVEDNKKRCERVASSSHRGVADLYALSNGDYGVRCNDGTSTAITLNNGVYCAIPPDGRSSECSSSSSFSAMANWVCQ